MDDQIWEEKKSWVEHFTGISLCVSVRFQLFIIIPYRDEHFAINRPSQPTEVLLLASQGRVCQVSFG